MATRRQNGAGQTDSPSGTRPPRPSAAAPHPGSPPGHLSENSWAQTTPTPPCHTSEVSRVDIIHVALPSSEIRRRGQGGRGDMQRVTKESWYVSSQKWKRFYSYISAGHPEGLQRPSGSHGLQRLNVKRTDHIMFVFGFFF